MWTVRSAVLGTLRTLIVLIAPLSRAQSAIVFPAVTETSVTNCSITEPPLPGPAGGTVRLRGGQYINYGGTLYVTTIGHSCGTDLVVTFSPAATDVSIAVKGLISGVNDVFLFEIREPSGLTTQQFTVPPQGTATMQAQGEITSVAVRSVRTGLPTNFWAFGISSIAIAQPPLNNSDVTFDAANAPEDSKILISKAVWDVGYPSRFQLPPNGTNPRIKVSGTLRDRFSGQGTSGPVYLRIDDPPDPAPYRGGDSAFGDNDGAASLSGGSTVTLQADAQGRFATELEVSKAIAGDNYQIVGATNAQFNCGGLPCARSPVFTLWKRIYVEEQFMFRRGAFLNDETVAGKHEIPVEDPTPFQGLAAGEMLQLVHAEAGFGEGFYSDRVVFDSVKLRPDNTWAIVTSAATPIPRKYGLKPNPNIAPNPFLQPIRDGVGVVSAGTFQTNPAYTEPLFTSMFVELKPNPGVVTEVPYLAEITKQFANFYANRWLQQGVRTSTLGSTPDPNVFHRIGARQAPLVQVAGMCHGAQVGITGVGGGGHYSYVFDQRIRDVAAGLADPTAGCPLVGLEYKGAPPLVINGEVTAHETVHLWVRTPRQPDMDTQGHCPRTRYIDATNCLMHRPYAGPELFDGQVLLHYDMNGAHSEYMWIRRDPDPVPQQ